MYNDLDIRFKYRGLIIRVSEEAWNDADMLNKNRNEAIRIAEKKIAQDKIDDGEVLILSRDVIENRN